MKSLFKDYKMSYWMAGENPTTAKIIRDIVRDMVLRLICWGMGHQMVDTSYGGPDTGCVSFHCKRCGYSIHTTLY